MSSYTDKTYGLVKQHTKTCETCRNVFTWFGRKKTRAYKRARYCSISCAHSRINSGPKPKWHEDRICTVCKKKFSPDKKYRKRCVDCVQKNRRTSIRRRRPVPSLLDIKKRIKIDSKSGCWVWQGAKTPQGYGIFGYTDKDGIRQISHVHRYVHKLSQPELKDTEVVRHSFLCTTTLCCNPKHLKGGTHKDNYYDSLSKHQEATKSRKGKFRAANRVPCIVNGTRYESMGDASKALNINYGRVLKIAIRLKETKHGKNAA